jgi:hypothetical protein
VFLPLQVALETAATTGAPPPGFLPVKIANAG